MSPLPEAGPAELLLRLLRSGRGEPASAAEAAGLLRLARLHRVAPLLHETCARLGGEPGRGLRGLRLQAISQSLRWQKTLAQAAAALRGEPGLPGAAVRFAVVKGADFAASLYPLRELRPHADIDVMVAPRDFAAACARLEAAGFRHHAGTRAGPESRPGWHERTFVHPRDPHAPVDLHQAFAQPQRTRLDVAALLERSAAADELAPGARRLSPEDAALAFCSNLATHELRLPLISFCDLARLLPRCDPGLLAVRAGEARLLRPLYAALDLLCTLAPEGALGGARFDAGAARALALELPLSRPLRGALALLVARYDLQRRAQPRPAQLVRKALLIDRPLDATRFLAAHLAGRLRPRVAVVATGAHRLGSPSP